MHSTPFRFSLLHKSFPPRNPYKLNKEKQSQVKDVIKGMFPLNTDGRNV